MKSARDPPPLKFFTKNFQGKEFEKMNSAEIQRTEIQTIAPRTFKLNLSDADVGRLFKKAAEVSLTPEQLLENFIGDLVNGTYSNGSDERMLAGEWFDRCPFSYFFYDTFLAYLVRDGVYENFTDLLDCVSECREQLEAIGVSDPESQKKYAEDIEYYSMRMDEASKDIGEIFDEYCRANRDHADYEQEIEKIFAYRENLKNALARKNEKEAEI